MMSKNMPDMWEDGLRKDFDAKCPKCGKIFGRGNTVAIDDDKVECCNRCITYEGSKAIFVRLVDND